MGLSLVASACVDVGLIVCLIIAVFAVLYIIRWLSGCIKTYRENREADEQVLPQQNSTTATSSHRSRAIALELPGQPHQIKDSALAGSVVPYVYKESEHVGAESCIVCLYPLQGGAMVIRLPACGHLLHDACVSQWFVANSVCPGCGVPVKTESRIKLGTV